MFLTISLLKNQYITRMKTLAILAGMLIISCSSFAQTFEVDGISYNVSSAVEPFTVQVMPIAAPGYVGDIVVPAQVTHNDTIFSVTAIADYAFANNDQLSTLDFQCPIVFLSFKTFRESENLTLIKFPATLAVIEPCAFWGCISLEEIVIHPDNLNFVSVDGVFYNKTMTKLYKYPPARIDDDYEIPATVDSIRAYAFNYCNGLDSLVIPDHVSVVGEYSFSNTRNLKYLDLGNGIPFFAQAMIYGSQDLLTIRLGDSFSTIQGYDFNTCPKLMNIYVTETNSHLKDIDGVLYSKDGSVLFRYPGAREDYNIPYGVNSIGRSAFDECRNLKSVNIPGSIVTINSGAFRDCDSLKSIEIPNSVRDIYGSAFKSCDLLESASIGNGLDSIGNSIFSECDSLRSVWFCSGIPPKYSGTNLGGAIDTIYVISGSVEVYQQDAFWGQYIVSGVENCSVQYIEPSNQVTTSVYPNPADSKITIYVSDKRDAIFKIYNLTGQCMLSQLIQNEYTMNVEWLNAGLYIYIVEQNNKTYSGKLLKN